MKKDSSNALNSFLSALSQFGRKILSYRLKRPYIYYIRAREQLEKEENIAKIIFQAFIKRKLLLASFIILLVLVPMSFLLLRNAKHTEAAWFNDNWQYRQSVQVTNAGTGSQSNYQVGITLDTATLITAGKMLSTCNDIRITDINGKILPYVLEKSGVATNWGCNKSTTKIWVKSPSINTGTSTYYIYYGNPSAPNNEAIKNVFTYYAGANGSVLDSTVWGTTQTAGTATFTLDSTQSLFSTNSFKIARTSGQGQMWNLKNTYQGTSYAIGVWNYDNAAETTNGHAFRTCANNCSNELVIGVDTSRSTTNYEVVNTGGGNTCQARSTGWHYYEIVADGSASVKAYIDGTLCVTINSGYTNYNIGPGNTISYGGGTYEWIGYPWVSETGNSWFDSYRLRIVDQNISIGSPANEEKANGPTSYWKFDEGYGTQLYDSTQGGANAAMGTGNSAPSWLTEDQCVAGKCLRFNGSTTFATVAAGNGITTALSISLWMKIGTTAVPSGHRMMYTSSNAASYLSVNTDGKAYPFFSLMIGGVQRTLSSNFIPQVGTWYLVSATYDGSNMNLYVNGDLMATSATYTGSVAGFNTGTQYIGKYSAAGYEFYGDLDEIKLYPYARTAAQITSEYTAGTAHIGSVKGISAGLGANRNNDAALNNGLLGYWKMDEATWTNDCSTNSVIDSSGNGYNAQVCPTTTGETAPVSAHFNKSGFFDGTDDYVQTAFSSLKTANNFSISIWFKTNSTAFASYLLWEGQSTGNGFGSEQEMHLGFGDLQGGSSNANELSFFLGANQFGGTTSTLQCHTPFTDTTAWHHVVVTVSSMSDSPTCTLYLDGAYILNDSGTTTDTARSNWDTNLRFGRPGAATRFYNGYMDDVRIYSRALSPAEVQTLYNWTPGPAGYWNFDEGTGTSVNDISGQTNTGSWNGTGTRWTNGKFGKAGKFAVSTSDYVTTSTAVASASNVTVGMWVYPTTTATDSYIFDATPSGNNFTVIWYPTSSFYKGFAARFSGSGGAWAVSKSVASVNTWHYVAATSDGTTISLYVDGVGIGTTNYESAYTPSKFYIGSNTVGTGNFNGSIDEVKVYNYARTQKQIIEDMNGGHPTGGSPVGSTLGYWKMDEGYGTTLYDASPNGNTGTLTNMSSPATATSGWNLSGKYNSSLQFDGTDDYVNIGNNSAVQLTSGTLSAWIKTSNAGASYRGIFAKQQAYGMLLKDNVFMIYDWGTSTDRTTNINLGDGKWHHVALTFQSGVTNGTVLYIDGMARLTTTMTVSNQNNNLQIGWSNAVNQYFSGTIDEVKIYASVLTSSEILIDYNRGQGIVLGSYSTDGGGSFPDSSSSRSFCVPGDTSTCSPPVGYWTLDEGTGTLAKDISGNSNPGTWGGTGSSHWVSGKIGKSGNFNGSDDRIDITNSTSLNPASTLSVSAWFKTSSTAGQIIFRKRTSGYGLEIGNFASGAAAGKVSFWYYDGAVNIHTATSTLTYNDNIWHFAVGTFDGTTVKIYIDGLLVGSTASSNAISYTAGNIGIGRDGDNSAAYFNGQIDDVKVFAYARTQAQVAWDYNRGKAQLWYKFDEGQGSTAYDASGNGLNGLLKIKSTGSQTAPGNVTTVDTTTAWYNGRTGKINSSLNFDGTDDYVVSTTGISTVPSSSVSLSVWIKPNSGGGVVVTELGTTTPNTSWHASMIEVETNKDVKVCMWTGAATCAVAGRISSFGTWNHVVMVYDSSVTKLYGYLNGNLGATATATKLNSNTGTTYYALGPIDSTNGGNGVYYSGQIDEFKVFNYALNRNQIIVDYNAGAASFSPLTGSP